MKYKYYIVKDNKGVVSLRVIDTSRLIKNNTSITAPLVIQVYRSTYVPMKMDTHELSLARWESLAANFKFRGKKQVIKLAFNPMYSMELNL